MILTTPGHEAIWSHFCVRVINTTHISCFLISHWVYLYVHRFDGWFQHLSLFPDNFWLSFSQSTILPVLYQSKVHFWMVNFCFQTGNTQIKQATLENWRFSTQIFFAGTLHPNAAPACSTKASKIQSFTSWFESNFSSTLHFTLSYVPYCSWWYA